MIKWCTIVLVMALSQLLSDVDQELLAECLARVMGHGYGEVRLIVDKHQVRFIKTETSHKTATIGKTPFKAFPQTGERLQP